MTLTMNDCTLSVLDAQALATMVGVQPHELPAACVATLAANTLDFEILVGDEREEQLLRALRGGEADDLRVSGPHRAADWERGWHENLRDFDAAGGELAQLVPKYNHHRVLRFGGDYVRVADGGFEYAVYTALRQWCFRRWFADAERVVEYGCGTGTSLVLLAETFPRLQLCGLDWAASAIELLGKVARRIGRPIEAQRFDLFAPGASPTVKLGPGTAVFTSAALEQVGERFEPWLDHVLAGNPSVCVHLEPLLELYDTSVLFDDVAHRYHVARNYLRGFVPRLRELERQGRVEILELRRTGFGSFFHEGYGLVVWRPTATAPRGR